MIGRPDPCVYLVTSRHRLSPAARTERDRLVELERFVESALLAGVDVIQVREPDLEAGFQRDCVTRIVARAAGTRTRVLVNDRVDIAVVAGAHGVHVPGRGIPVAHVRRLFRDRLVGRSVHSAPDITGTVGVDYVLFGSVFASESKAAGSPVTGIEGLRAAVRIAPVPVVAIGGMTVERAAQCVHAGASGVAAIGLFLPAGRGRDAVGVAAAVPALRAAMHTGMAERSRDGVPSRYLDG